LNQKKNVARYALMIPYAEEMFSWYNGKIYFFSCHNNFFLPQEFFFAEKQIEPRKKNTVIKALGRFYSHANVNARET